jgi:hypothetical protein
MAELLLVSNPRKRRRRRKMTAKQRKYFGKRRRHRRRKHAAVAVAAPRRRRRRYAHRRRRGGGGRRVPSALGYTVGSKRIRRRKLNPHRRRHHYRRHRNPYRFGDVTRQFMPTLREGGWGAIGALGNDVGYGFVAGLLQANVPTIGQYLTNPYVGFIAKAFNAVIVGSLGGMMFRGRARQLAVGAMTVVTHDFLKTMLQQTAPTIFGPGGSVPLGGYGAYLSGSAPIVGTATVPQAYMPFSGMGAYLSGAGGSGMTEGSMYVDDQIGMDPWGGSNPDGRVGYS